MDEAPPGNAVGSDRLLRLARHAVVLRRSPTDLQVGVEPSVVVPRPYGPLLGALARGVTQERLRQVAGQSGLQAGTVADLLGALQDAGLLQPPAVAATQAVRVVGAGVLGTRTALELVGAGFSTVYLADLPEHGPPDEQPAPRPGGRHPRRAPRRTTGQPARVELLAAALGDARPGVRVRRTRHFTKPEGDAVALTVVVADGPEPDRLVPDLLREHGAPHLLVRCRGDEAVIGPLVVPGVTSCVRCADLAQRDADPRWPWLLDQLTRLRVEPSPTLLAWAGVTAAVQALAFVGGGTAETLGRTLELGSAPHALRLRTWPVHPECPCRWEGDRCGVGQHAQGRS